MKKNILFIPLILLCSCTTYLIPVQSFKEQMLGADSVHMKDVLVKGSFIGTQVYRTNSIEWIKCTYKDGKPAPLLKNRPSLEIRFTHGFKHKKSIFYFDQLTLNNNIVSGSQSRLLGFIHKSIPLDSISKIEIQDGLKNFQYAK